MEYDKLYKKLLECVMPFGYEDRILEEIKRIAMPYCDEAWIDECGSLVMRKKGLGRRVMLSAQVDVPTLLITYIEQDKRARFLLTGKSTPRIELSSKVIFSDGSYGVIEFEDDACNDNEIEKMFVKPIKGEFHIGQRGVLCGETALDKINIKGPHSGNISTCMAMLNIMKNVNCSNDVYYVFAVGSEAQAISQRGVLGAVFNIKPHMGISIEALETQPESFNIGKGPVVCLRDEHALISRKLLLSIRDYEDVSKNTLQYAALSETGRETALYHITSHGAIGVTLCIPVNGHNTEHEIVQLKDIDGMSVLVEKLMLMIDSSS